MDELGWSGPWKWSGVLAHPPPGGFSRLDGVAAIATTPRIVEWSFLHLSGTYTSLWKTLLKVALAWSAWFFPPSLRTRVVLPRPCLAYKSPGKKRCDARTSCHVKVLVLANFQQQSGV